MASSGVPPTPAGPSDSLRSLLQQHPLLFEAHPHPMWVFDRETYRFLAVNEAACQVYGYSRQEFLARTLFDIRPADQAEALQATLQAGPRPQVVRVVSRHLAKDGTPIEAEISSHDVAWGDRPARLVLAQNVTANRRSLEQAARRYRQLFEHNLAGVVSVTADGRILAANPAFVGLAGYADFEALAAAGGGAIFAKLGARLEKLRRHGPVLNQEIEIRRRDGERVSVLANLALLPADGELPERLEGTVVDLSEYKRLEQQFRQAQKMESVGLLAGGIAHDFNNLLTVIIGYTEMLLRSAEMAERDRRRLQAIAQAGVRASELTRQLMAFGRKQVFAPAPLDLNQALSRAAVMLRRMVGEEYELALELEPRLRPVLADGTQIEQVLMNLVVNARDAMAGGGRIAVRTRNASVDQDGAHAQDGNRKGDFVAFAVGDTGVGMDAATRARIFEPFFTTKPVGQGTGLGLATVFGIIQQHGGTISVTTEPGRGTSMEVFLPASTEAVADEEAAGEGEAAQGTETILLVEDETPVRTYAAEVLSSLGYYVLTAEGAEQAMALFEAQPGEIQLLVTDIIMPGMSGVELAQRLRDRQPELPVVFVSGYPGQDLSSRGLPEGAAFLQKPYAAPALAAAVRKQVNASAAGASG